MLQDQPAYLGQCHVALSVWLRPDQLGRDAFAFDLERGKRLVAVRDLPSGRAHPHRVDLATVDDQFVVQVRTGRQSGRSDIADDLPLPDPGPRRNALGDLGSGANRN